MSKVPDANPPINYVTTLREAFGWIRERALEASKNVDPATAELYREWAENLVEAQSVWEDLLPENAMEAPPGEVIERAIDATILTEASCPVGAERETEGGLLMQWLQILKKTDPGALRRKPKTGEALARRVALEMVLPDNPDRGVVSSAEAKTGTTTGAAGSTTGATSDAAAQTAELLDSAASLLLMDAIQHSQSIEDVLRTSRVRLMQVEMSGGTIPNTKQAVEAILVACTPKPRAPKAKNPLQRPAELRRPPGRPSGKAVRVPPVTLVARPKDGRVVIPKNSHTSPPNPFQQVGAALVEGIAAVGASIDAVASINDRLTKNQQRFRRSNGTVDWTRVLTALRA